MCLDNLVLALQRKAETLLRPACELFLAHCLAHAFTQLEYSSLRLTFVCTPAVPWRIRPGELDAACGRMPAALELAVGEAPQTLPCARAGNL